MKTMRTDILVTHPYRHHALNLAAGCARSGRATAFALPFYRRGLGAWVARVPGAIGRKASGYYHPGLGAVDLPQSAWWQMRKLLSFIGDNPRSIEAPYDAWVAGQLLAGRWEAKVVVTLQDHMPFTSAAAKQIGALLWSDQIINLSGEATARIDAHARAMGSGPLRHDEATNTAVLAQADVVTVPSAYTLQGIRPRLPQHASLHCIPYGVDVARFGLPRVVDRDTFTIVARANSIRKGGHLVLEAILRSHAAWAALVQPQRLRIVFLGACEPALAGLRSKAQALGTVDVQDGNIPSQDVPALLAGAALFVMPTLSESMSLACVEAMCAGLPLVITAHAGVDCFVDGEMGVLVQDDVDSIERGITRALSDAPRLQRWGANVRSAAASLGWEAYEARIARVASQACDAHAGSRGTR